MDEEIRLLEACRTSKNPYLYVLLAKVVVVHGETVNAFDKFRTSLFEDLKPKVAMEALLVDKIANYAWRLRRVVQAEGLMMHAGLSKEYYPKAMDDFFDGKDSIKLNNISRYEMMLSRYFYRATKELRELQNIRNETEKNKAALDFLGIGFVS